MYKYHGTVENEKRLATNRCRCASKGSDVHNVANLLSNGFIMNPEDPKRHLSTPKIKRRQTDIQPKDGGIGKTFIFAISTSLDIHIARDGDRSQQGTTKHETLFHNADVLAAGEIHIQDGVISALNDLSGSYNTAGKLESDSVFAAAALNAFKKIGVRVNDALREELNELTID